MIPYGYEHVLAQTLYEQWFVLLRVQVNLYIKKRILVHLWGICTMKARSEVFGWGSEDPPTLKLASRIRVKVYSNNVPQMLNNMFV